MRRTNQPIVFRDSQRSPLMYQGEKNFMKKYSIALIVCSVVGLTGCGDYTTPKGVVLTAAIAVKTNNVSDFKQAFGGAALATYGNAQGMAAIGSKLASITGLS